jgi:hypothetical protein
MIEFLDMHLLDLFQNALAARPSRIVVSVNCGHDRLQLRVCDDGAGMDAMTLAAVERGFYSSKCDKCVGLGLPLLREVAEHCDGGLRIRSAPGRGTSVTASFRRSHIDLPPFDDLRETFLAMLLAAEGPSVRLRYRCDEGELDLDACRLRELLGDVPLTHPEVIGFLRSYLHERIGGGKGGSRT